MSLSPSPVESFPGLNLVDDAGTLGWTGAIDLLNVDFAKRGRVRTRDGFAAFTSVAGAARYHSIAPFYAAIGSGTTRLIAGRSTTVEALSTAGASITTTTATGAASSNWGFARFGTPTTEYLIIATGGEAQTFDGTTLATETLFATGTQLVTVNPTTNRIIWVEAAATSGSGFRSTNAVRFSDAGALTYTANNDIQFTPGDGQNYRALVHWRDLTFIFKEERFFVHYGESEDSSGNPIFNYRTVEAGTGPVGPKAVCLAPDGVYFLAREGIYKTTGGPPVLVSGILDPFFRGGVSSFFGYSALSQSSTSNTQLHFVNNNLYAAVTTTGSTNNAMLVYDTVTDQWTLYDIPAAAISSFRISNQPELVFAYATGSNHIGRHSSAYTDDAGVAITSRYRSGFADLGSPDMKRIHSWRVNGSGSPTLKLSTDFGSLETGAALTLGTSPAVAEDVRRYAPRGRRFSWQLGGTSAWSANSLTAYVAGKRKSGEHA
jgi:hypothetical protein